MDKRYQVFLSSTFTDLQEERQKVFTALMQMDCIPAGMELFPAADEEQLAFIKKIIDDCDYYILIVGGRYGSVTADGFSFTEREYDYAISKGIKVLAFLHGNPEEIPSGKTDGDSAVKAKLEAFKMKISTGRIVKHWNTASELPGLVALSLSQTIKAYPAVGWVRADKVANETILLEVNELRKANNVLTTNLNRVMAHSVVGEEPLAGLDETYAIRLDWTTYYRGDSSKHNVTVKPTWKQIFGTICPFLMQMPNALTVKSKLGTGLFQLFKGSSDGSAEIDEQTFSTIGVQLMALGLVNIERLAQQGGGYGLFWTLTETGQRLMIQIRTIKSAKAVNEPAVLKGDDLEKTSDITDKP